MGRYRGPKGRLCRRFGECLHLKGDRELTGKCALSRRPNPPGQHGRRAWQARRSEFARQLDEKQKLRVIYGVSEGQMQRYYERAARSREVTGMRLLQLLESRLDNTVYRVGFADTRDQARQFVTHGHVVVNGAKVDRPSYQVAPGDAVKFSPRAAAKPFAQERLRGLGAIRPPDWLRCELEEGRVQVLRAPMRDEIDTPADEELVVAYYSR